MKSVVCCSELHGRTPPPATLVPLPFQGRLYTNLQTPYPIKSPTYTGKTPEYHITDTGKGNNRRWQATGGQREQRANSAGRFRHGSPRSYTSWVNPSTSLQNAVKNKVHRLHRKTPEYQHYRYRQGQPPALASHRRTARATSEFRRTVSTRQP